MIKTEDISSMGGKWVNATSKKLLQPGWKCAKQETSCSTATYTYVMKPGNQPYASDDCTQGMKDAE